MEAQLGKDLKIRGFDRTVLNAWLCLRLLALRLVMRCQDDSVSCQRDVITKEGKDCLSFVTPSVTSLSPLHISTNISVSTTIDSDTRHCHRLSRPYTVITTGS